MRSPFSVLATAVLLTAAAPSPTQPVDRAASRIGLRGADGRAFTGVFKRWTAQAAINPADLAHARLTLTLQVASVVTGDPSRDRALPLGLEAARFPTITFESRAATAPAPAPGRLRLEGPLEFKGVSRPATLDLTVSRMGGGVRVDGALPLGAALGGPSTLTVRLVLRSPR